MNQKYEFESMVADFLAISDLPSFAQSTYGLAEFEVAELTRVELAKKCAVIETCNQFK